MLEHIPILEMPIAYSSSVAFINQVWLIGQEPTSLGVAIAKICLPIL